MSYRQIYYHIVFNTHGFKPVLPEKHHDELYKYIWGIIKNKGCKLYRINGYTDHIHILSDLHPSIALADFVRDIKAASSLWLKKNKNFPEFVKWNRSYGGFTITHFDRFRIIEYIKNQKIHHKKERSLNEFKRLLKENGVDFDEKYLT